MNEVSVAVTGAAGQISYQMIFSILKGEVYGQGTKIHLKLIDIPQAIRALEGVVMEIEDGAYELLASVQIFSNSELEQAFHDIDFAFLVGASPRTKGMERSDLLQKNGQIFKTQGIALNSAAKKTVQVLVVGNPCNTNCFIAMNHAPNIPKSQFFAMTMLDEHRARFQVAKKAGVTVSSLEGVYIYGNHSATQYPDFENIRSNGKSVSIDNAWCHDVFVPMIQKRGAAVIEARGASSAASAAHAAITTARNIVTKAEHPFSVARVSQGEYGSPVGLVISMPCYFEQGHCIADKSYIHTQQAMELIKLSYQELIDEANQVKELGLIGD